MARAPPLHAAGPVFGGPSSAGRVRPSGSSLNGCENGSNGPINRESELFFPFFYERGSAHSKRFVPPRGDQIRIPVVTDQ